jgi:hypothetical protein
MHKYPRIDKKELDSINKNRFSSLFNKVHQQIMFDNTTNELGLSNEDIQLLAWNIATIIISQPY